MMEKRRPVRDLALSVQALYALGFILLAAGCAGALIQTRVLGVDQISNEQLLELIRTEPGAMAYATVALICQALEICAVPLFAFILTEQVRRCSSFFSLLGKTAGVAVVCQVPYNLLYGGQIFIPGDFDPAFAAVISLAMLWFFKTFPGKKAAHIVIKAAAALGALLWSTFLGIAWGVPCVLISAALWMAGDRQNVRVLAGCGAAIVCAALSSPLFMVSPLAFLAVHLYNGESEEGRSAVRLIAYPGILAAFAMLSLFL